MRGYQLQVLSEEHFCAESIAEPCGLVIFGASGDLAHRKLIPALYRLFQRGLLPSNFYILGYARTQMTDAHFREKVAASAKRASSEGASESLSRFLERCVYSAGDYGDASRYALLARRLEELDQKYATRGNRIFYLATPPNVFCDIVSRMAGHGLTRAANGSPWVRVVIEKPFGRDLKTALALDAELHRSLSETQIYRMDHYLGKETVQNILVFRFANSVFEPVWNCNYVDHVQITAAETVGVEHRAGYFDQTGLLRDMFQNHMLQMLTLVAMEPPTCFEADAVRDEKIKLLRAIRPFALAELGRWVVRGQYAAGQTSGQLVPAYRQEASVDPNSQTETYIAAKVLVDNPRWRGVPFYIRAGKRLARRASQIAVVFKKVPHSIFASVLPEGPSPNALIFNVQPQEGVSLAVYAKRPGPGSCMSVLQMDFQYREVFGVEPPDAYERLLLDCVSGDQTLFTRHDSIEAAWSLLTPVLDAWEAGPPEAGLRSYEAGGWGPAEGDALLERDGRQWRNPQMGIGV